MATATAKGMETKHIGGRVIQCKEIERDGKRFGIVEGHLATFDIDRGDDRFSPGAFEESLAELRRIGKTQLPFKDAHGRTVGGFPLETVKEDSKGLFGIGEINLEIERGRDAYSLAQQKVYDSFSIGFIPEDVDFIDGIREIRKAEVLEGSLLDIPMNLSARVTEVKAIAEKLGINIEDMEEDDYKKFLEHVEKFNIKAATSFKDLPLADEDMKWDAAAAKARVKVWAGAEEGLDTSAIQKKYKGCFFWYDAAEPDVFASYKLPFTDIIDGKLTAVPRGVFAAAAAMRGARGGVDIPDADRPGVIKHIERYYAKMDRESPFKKERAFRVESLQGLDERTLEGLLKSGVSFSGTIAKALVRVIKASDLREAEKEVHREGDDDWSEVLGELKQIERIMED